MPDLDQRSLPGAGRGKNRGPLFNVGTDEVGEFLRRTPNRVGNRRGNFQASKSANYQGCGIRLTRKPSDERTLLHSITSSARPSSEIGTVIPSALAVLRLRMSSTFVACCTGRSEGFSPLRMRP